MSTNERVQLSRRAIRDLRRVDAPERRRVRAALQVLAAGSNNLDVKPLAGVAPWQRLRVGDWRVLYRPLSDAETGGGDPGILVAPVVNRRNLLRAVRSLQT